MKSMTQMQNEMLSQCRFDGSFPKPVVLPFGVLALARDQAEYDHLCRESDRMLRVFGGGLLLVAAVTLAGIAYLALQAL